ncbi:hypothetical protein ES703_06412 [subsurface metagenome]
MNWKNKQMKKPMPGLLLLLAIIGLAGCYNNAHLRTQQLLDPGEKVVSGSGVLALSGEMRYGDLNNTGVSGLRGEVSFLTGKQGGESGPYFGLGLVDETVLDIIAGYEIKRYTRLNTALPWKLGLQAEVNLNLGGTGYVSGRGPALHLRPSYTSTTTRKRPFYGGLHGLVSLGSMESYTGWEEYAGEGEWGPIYDWHVEDVGYQFYSFGAGITAGFEAFSQMNSLQLQVDASWVYGHCSSREYTPSSEYPSSPSSSTFMVTGSVGLNFFRPEPSSRRPAGPYPAAPVPPKEVPEATAPGEPQPQFDPETGLPIKAAPIAPAQPQFDPETGLPAKAEPEAPAPPQFDPVTGELIPPEPARTKVTAKGTPPVFSETALMTLARNNAKRDHNTATWGIGGGLLGCGGMFAGSMAGAMVAEGFGFIIGAVVGGAAAAEGLASVAPAVIPIPEELESADPDLHEKYHQIYQAETHKLRRKSTYKGVIGAGCAAAAAAAAAMFILISSGPPMF